MSLSATVVTIQFIARCCTVIYYVISNIQKDSLTYASPLNDKIINGYNAARFSVL